MLLDYMCNAHYLQEAPEEQIVLVMLLLMFVCTKMKLNYQLQPPTYTSQIFTLLECDTISSSKQSIPHSIVCDHKIKRQCCLIYKQNSFVREPGFSSFLIH